MAAESPDALSYSGEWTRPTVFYNNWVNALVKDIVGESENSSDDFFQGFSSGFA